MRPGELPRRTPCPDRSPRDYAGMGRLELGSSRTHSRGATLDPTRWLPFYLPHWKQPPRAHARGAGTSSVTGRVLRLRIEGRPAAVVVRSSDGEIKVSSLQTGSSHGAQQPASNPAAVREGAAVPAVRLYTARYGRIEVRAKKATDEPRGPWFALVADRLRGRSGSRPQILRLRGSSAAANVRARAEKSGRKEGNG